MIASIFGKIDKDLCMVDQDYAPSLSINESKHTGMEPSLGSPCGGDERPSLVLRGLQKLHYASLHPMQGHMLRTLRGIDANAALAAAKGLVSGGDAKAIQPLLDMVAYWGKQYVTRYHQNASVSELKLIQQVRAWGLNAVGVIMDRTGSRDGISALMDINDQDPDPWIRTTIALVALGLAGAGEALPRFLEAFESQDPKV